jgi:hypothetical protein
MFFRDGNIWEEQAVVHLQKELHAAVANDDQQLSESELIEQWIAAQHKRARLAETVLNQVCSTLYLTSSAACNTDSWC